MAGWSDTYLALVRQRPTITRAEAAEELNVTESALKARLLARTDVRDAERAIRDQFHARQRLEALGAAATQETATLEDDLPLHFVRFLEIYSETDDRIKTVKQMRSEGFDISWRDVVEAMAAYPHFGRAMAELWDEGVIEAEDAYRQKARVDARTAKGFLAANMPGKYGSRVKVDVDVRHQLTTEHRKLVGGIKSQFIVGMKGHQVQPPELSESAEDVVDGEVVG